MSTFRSKLFDIHTLDKIDLLIIFYQNFYSIFTLF